MARVIALTARYPFPIDDGWKMRTAHLLGGMATGGHEVRLVTLTSPDDDLTPGRLTGVKEIVGVPRGKAYSLPDIVRGLATRTPLPVLNYRSDAFASCLARLAAREPADALVVEDIVMAQYALAADVPVKVLDMHNVESHLMRRYARQTGNLAKKAYAALTAIKLARYERHAAAGFDAVFTCSDADRERLLSLGTRTPISVVPNGIAVSSYDDVARSPSEEDIIAFVGSMDYHANISGVLAFVRDTLPLVLAARPNTQLHIIGKNPPAEVRALASPGIVVTGTVPDVRPHLARATVVVVPLLVGGGTRLKILEAMAAARPVVSTRLGAEGLEGASDWIVLADQPRAFADAVIDLLSHPDRRARLARGGREFVQNHYDWGIISAAFNDELSGLLAAHGIR